MQDFKPLGIRVLIVKDAAEKTTSGGILMPDSAQQVTTQGTVLAVGPAVTELEVGQRVLFGPRGGTEVAVLGKTLHMFREEDIYGVFV